MLYGISNLYHPHLHPANLTPINKSHYQHPTLNCLSFPFSSLRPMRLYAFWPLSSLGKTKKQQRQPTLSLRKASSNMPQNLKFKNKNKEKEGGDGDKEEPSGGGGGGSAALKGAILAGLLLVGVVGGFGAVGWLRMVPGTWAYMMQVHLDELSFWLRMVPGTWAYMMQVHLDELSFEWNFFIEKLWEAKLSSKKNQGWACHEEMVNS